MRCPSHLGGEALVRCNFTSLIFLLVLAVVVYIVIMVHVQTTVHFKPAVEYDIAFAHRLNSPPEKIFNFNLTLDKVIHRTHKRYLSFSIDSSVIKQGLKNPSLRSRSLIAKLSHLNGGYLRIGGTAADLLVFSLGFRSPSEYELPSDGGFCSYDHIECHYTPNSSKYKKFAMSADNWNDINYFSKETGLKVLFDLNGLLRGANGWNSSNAELLMDVSFAYQYDIDWQLGNEPNSYPHTFKTSISPSELSSDFGQLRKLVNKYTLYNHSTLVGPDVTNPRHLSEDPVEYLDEFLASKPQVDAISWHHYYLRPNSTLGDFLNVEVYNSFIKSADTIGQSVKTGAPEKQIWLTETGSAFGGGVEGISNKFVSSFLWADKLGAAAKRNISVVVRQSLYKGRYSLLDPITLNPNPDYWVSVLFRQLVGREVLSVQCSDEDYDETLRVYAHCGKGKKPVLFGVNISNYSQGLNLFLNSTGYLFSLTSPDLLSTNVLLNGQPLDLDPFDGLPPLNPLKIQFDAKNPVPVLPYSVFFLVIDISLPICQI